jgi:hypothetical protein
MDSATTMIDNGVMAMNENNVQSKLTRRCDVLLVVCCCSTVMERDGDVMAMVS